MKEKIAYFIHIFNDDYIFRSCVLILFSLFADIVLGGYYIILALIRPAKLWVLGLAGWYALFSMAKAALFSIFRKKTDETRKVKVMRNTTVCFLLLMGAEIVCLSAYMFFTKTHFILPDSALYINGAILATIIFSFTGKKFYAAELVGGTFYRCKKYLSRIEGFFFLILTLQKVIGFFNIENISVNFSFFLCSIALCIYSLILAFILIVKYNIPSKI